jgi:hypothetical protein
MPEAVMSAGRTDYWVRISQRGTALGAGFILSSHYALTAAHCLKRMDVGDGDVELTLGTGEEIPGRVCELAAGADLALIRVLKPPDCALGTPKPDLAVRGDTWIAPYRPIGSDPLLQGDVVSGAVAHKCAAGVEIEALQFNCSQRVESYYGYSGGPVERHREDPQPALFGMLLEQSFDRKDGIRVTNVMWAVTIREAERRFGYLGTGHYLNVLSGDESIPDEHSALRVSQPAATPTLPQGPDPDLPDHRLDSGIAHADSRIRAVRTRVTSGVLSPETGTVLELRIALRLEDL